MKQIVNRHHVEADSSSPAIKACRNIICRFRRLEIPIDTPDFPMIGKQFTIDYSGLVVGEQLVPSSGPDVVIARTKWKPRRPDARMIPKQIDIQRLINQVVNSGANFGKDYDTEERIFKNHRAKIVLDPTRVDSRLEPG